ncbi:unnamed protein product, partial [Cladocopium goreaui]
DYLRPIDVVQRFLGKAGGSSCELPKVDASKLSADDFEDLAQQHPGGLVLQNLQWLKPEDWTRETLLKRFGAHWISSGSGRWDRPEATPEVRLKDFAEVAAGTAKSWVAKGYTHEVVSTAFWGFEGNCSGPVVANWHCGQAGARLFAGFEKRPTLQLGMSLASGTQLHRHEETWLALLHGIKAWWIASEPPSEEVEREERANTRHPCQWLEERRPKGLRFCVQQPGEVVYFATRLHATCNMADYVLGIGAQGREPSEWSKLERAVHRGQSGLVKKFLKEKRAPPSGHQRQHWLGHAAEYGFTSLVKVLLDHRANLHRGADLPPLHRAAENGHDAVVRLLLARRADVRSKDVEDKEPLHHAAFNDNGHVAQLLLEHRASLTAADQRKLTAFGSAADGGYPELMETLLDGHAPKTARGYETSAVHAASKGHLPVLRKLLAWRADVALPDASGRRLVDHAEFYQHHSVAAFLRSYDGEAPPSTKKRRRKGKAKPQSEEL